MLPALLLLAGLAESAADWHTKGMAFVASGQLADARNCFTRAIALDPNSTALRINLGAVLVKLGRNDEATRQFQTVLSREPGQLSALFNLGVIYLETGNPKPALKLLEQARNLAPTDEEIHKRYLLALSRAGSPAAIRNALATFPSSKCELTIGLGKELAARHSYELALEQFRREKLCQPHDISPVLGEASALLALGHPQEAIDSITTRADEARKNKHGRFILGSAYERLGNYTEAFDHFAAAVDLDPEDARARMALGLLGLKAKAPQLSAKVFNDAADRFPNRPEFQLGKALVSQATGNANEAEKQCQALLARHPDYLPGTLFLVALHLDAARFDSALQVLRRVPATGSPLLKRYLRASILFAQAEQTPSVDARPAMQALEASLGTDARFADGHILLARYYRTSNTTAAEQHLRSALKAEPNSWQARAILAQLHRKQGQAVLARVETEQAERLRRDVKHSQSLLWQFFYGDPTTP